MYGPANVPLTRETLKDDYIGDIPVKKGTYVTLNGFARHYS